mmetsp:Transcript_42561/g.109905  ORF Transcript_42561/g.109905 Transcript_42561/m.109905 type:complete len:453 (-) Transcript_42561:141-1499(-)|eukprot:CAMPEP_0195067512 /NCGR_PEP_ID=MMETSP0448-20130528/12544_1 /TAXON_ID=66468 /ORGANISM="Heterocapsa triquestra, Strain CCMP 448" /LENGTH=452 /DNA_ID=CAMNT_0040098933 /DNA_START=155 /DNA_END=1513 /DNA_ORIENTATION=-
MAEGPATGGPSCSSAEQWLAAGCSELPTPRSTTGPESPQKASSASPTHGAAPATTSKFKKVTDPTLPVKIPTTLANTTTMVPPPPAPPAVPPAIPPGKLGASPTQRTSPPPPPMPRGQWAPNVEGWSSSSTKSWYHPRHYKKRFCAWYPDASKCRRGEGCAFAHSRDEVRSPLLTAAEEEQDPSVMTEQFFMYKFKTHWCPLGIQHNWQTCVYAHNYQDARRDLSIGYGSAACPHWNRHETGAEYWQRCPLGVYCPYAHGAKETLYHPEVFRTVICRDRCDKSACPRQRFCAFFHGKYQVRRPGPSGVDYRKPLPTDNVEPTWLDDFLTQPFPPGDNAMSAMDRAIAERISMWQHYAVMPPPAPAPWMMAAQHMAVAEAQAHMVGRDPYDPYKASARGITSPRTQSTASSDRGGALHDASEEELLMWSRHWAATGGLAFPPQYAMMHGRGVY